MSQGSGDRGLSEKKSAGKCRYLSCRSCNTPRPDGSEYYFCAACRSNDFPVEEQPLSNKEVLLWMKDFVHDAFKEFKKRFTWHIFSLWVASDRKPGGCLFPQRFRNCGRIARRVLDEINSYISDTDTDQNIKLFLLEKRSRLFKGINLDEYMQSEVTGEDSIPKKIKAFIVNNVLIKAYD